MAARKVTAIRLSEEEREELRAKAKACGMTTSAYTRKVSLGCTPRCLTDVSAVGQLRAIGHNLNQLTKRAHLGQLDAGAADELRRLRASLDLLMEALW